MPQQTRSGASRRILRIGLVATILLVSSLSAALAHQATPASDDDTRLYIGHAGGFVAHIPDDWVPDRSLTWDHAGRDGFVMTRPVPAEFLGSADLDEACRTLADDDRFRDLAVITHSAWREQPACEIHVENERQGDPVSLVFAHPDSHALGDVVWVAVSVDVAHFDDVVGSISFDTTDVTVSAYLDSVLDILETRSLWRDAIDWDDLRERAHERLGRAGDGTSLASAATPIRYVIDELHRAGADRHTVFLPDVRSVGGLAPGGITEVPPSHALDGNIGYVTVPTFGGDPEQSQRYIGELHARIAEQEAAASCGWIVDLRVNQGGGIIPMVTGLSPILPPGVVLTVRNVAGDVSVWELTRDGVVTIDGEAEDWVAHAARPADPVLSTQPVAVLTGRSTASAAEGTAIAFIGRDNTAFFGEPTAALATVPDGFPLLGGAMLMVSASWMSGPQGAIYPDGIVPDVVVRSGARVDSLEDDPVVEAATDWLRQQPGCNPAATPPA